VLNSFKALNIKVESSICKTREPYNTTYVWNRQLGNAQCTVCRPVLLQHNPISQSMKRVNQTTKR